MADLPVAKMATRVTAKSVWINGRRECRESAYVRYFDSFDDAIKRCWSRTCADRQAAISKQASAKSHLAVLDAMTEEGELAKLKEGE